ncbi:MAG TPA: histidine phosphatase family protein [Candidatus Saccharimonadales bacterium]
MAREILLIRHGSAEEPSKDQKIDPFGPPLTTASVVQIAALRSELLLDDFEGQPIATSTKMRAIQTGALVGASSIHIHAQLDEVQPSTPVDELKRMLANGQAPEELMRYADIVLGLQPVQDRWVVHGWLGAGIVAKAAEYLGQNLEGTNLLLPNLGMRRIEIPS